MKKKIEKVKVVQKYSFLTVDYLQDNISTVEKAVLHHTGVTFNDDNRVFVFVERILMKQHRRVQSKIRLHVRAV